MEKLFTDFQKLGIAIFAGLTFVFVLFAMQIDVNSDFKKFLPLSHPYLQNMMKHKADLTLGHDIRIVIQARDGDIFTQAYLDWIREFTDRLYALPGVDKTHIKSLWTPNARWIAVTQDGFRGGELIPSNYDGSVASLDEVRSNIQRSSEIGRIVADDFQSTSLYVPLIWHDDHELDYKVLNSALEALRDESEAQGYTTHMIGVPKKIGALIEGAHQMMLFFVGAVVFIFCVLLMYTQSVYVAGVLSLSGICGVIWQLGLMSVLGQFMNVGLDPYSMLVPFLIFAIAISHGLQLFSRACDVTLAQDISDNRAHIGQSGWFVFKKMCKPALVALSSDALGFATLAIIPIAAIQDLALTASIGILCLFVTTLLFVPLVISMFGVSKRFLKVAQMRAVKMPAWACFSLFGMRGWVGRLVIASLAMSVLAWGGWKSQELQIGDLRTGAPELRPDSRYNQDIAYFVEHYSQSADVYVVLIETMQDQCNVPEVLFKTEALQYKLEQLSGVQHTLSLASVVKLINAGLNEGHPKWSHIPVDQMSINGTTANLPSGFMNLDCSFSPLYVFLKDHKAATLAAVTDVVMQFDQELLDDQSIAMRTLPAAGNAGIEAAVNESIAQQQELILWVIYAIVLVICWYTFRRLSLVFAILIPLGMTSLLCQALMVILGIGVKVSTLPVIALGVGIGVDYGVYMCARYVEERNIAKTLADTGRIVFFTGLALAISVGFWMLSAIQFQADMGVLLTFMFLWNMIGALVLLPFLLGLARIFHEPDGLLGT